MSYYNSRFGEQKVNSIIPQMKQVGQSEGIDFSYGGYIGNTFNSHRLIWKAREEGGSELQDKVVESIFKAYFEEEKSLGENSVLKACAERAGMDATSLLAEESMIGKEETKREMNEFRNKYRCTGVPFFVVDEKYALSGAQPPEQILSVFQELV
mmetsp:Transcript_52019/g.77086  ORF Transcript_52019/g.77086 Transcript_52019/m.77086 type:complete len:154 (+) Transcript_52019:376-837(+)